MKSCIAALFSNSDNHPDLDAKLRERGVSPVPDENTEGKLTGQYIVLTGKLTAMPRSMAAELIVSLGGNVQSSVTRETTLVIAGEDAGSKLAKAKAAGIKVIGESEFLSLVNA